MLTNPVNSSNFLPGGRRDMDDLNKVISARAADLGKLNALLSPVLTVGLAVSVLPCLALFFLSVSFRPVKRWNLE